MNKNKRIIIATVVILVLAIASAGWMLRQRSLEQDTPEGWLVLYGNADIREVELAFNGSDRIAQILVEEGDRVDAGQVVGRLDTSRLEPELHAAAARTEAQRQVVARPEAGSRPEEIRRAEAANDQALAMAKDAKERFDEVKNAYDKGAANVRELQSAQRNLDAEVAAQRVAGETLALVKAGPRKEDIAEAKAMLQVDQADLALAQQRLDDAELLAPSVGVIRARLLEPGDMASPFRPALTLALTDPLWIRAYVDEPDLGRLQLGMEAEVTTDSFPGKHYTGWVGYIAPTAEFTPKTVESRRVRTNLVYEVRVFVRNPDDELRLGMPATVSIDLHSASNPSARNPPATGAAQESNPDAKP